MDIENYNDETALTEYVWRHYQHLMTALAKRVGFYTLPIVSDSPIEKARLLYQKLEVRDGHVADAEVWESLKNGMAAFRLLTMKRLVAKGSNELIVNRCGVCKRLTRTPTARQCTWCGASWHDSNDDATNDCRDA